MICHPRYVLQKNVASLVHIFIPDHLKTQEMCDKAVAHNPRVLDYIPDKFKTQEMYIKAVEIDPLQLRHVCDEFKTQKMCIKAVKEAPRM